MIYSDAKAAETLHLGAVLPFQARIGIQMKNIYLMNADLINKQGGLTIGGKRYVIEYHIYDGKYDTDTSRAAVERLVSQDKVKFIVSTFSAGTFAALPITEPNKTPLFSQAVSEKILDPKIKYHVCTFANKFCNGLVKAFTENRPEFKKIQILTLDNEIGHALAPVIEKIYKFFGMTTSPTLFFKYGEMDLSRIAVKVVSEKPDLFYGLAISNDAALLQLVKALKDAGYKGPILLEHATQGLMNDIVARVGKKEVEGLLVASFDPTILPENIKPREALELRENYEKYYGKWETDAIQFIGGWYTWLATVKKADSLDPDKVMAAIDRNLEIKTPEGIAKFFTRPDLGNNRYCDYAKPILTGIVKDGKVEFLFRKDADYMISATEQVYGVKMR
jgi:branched-chain amino acid transport system substrate-binding protein